MQNHWRRLISQYEAAAVGAEALAKLHGELAAAAQWSPSAGHLAFADPLRYTPRDGTGQGH